MHSKALDSLMADDRQITGIVDAHHHIWKINDLDWLKGPTQPRIFGDYSYNDNKTEIETIGNTTLIPNSVIKEIKKLT